MYRLNAISDVLDNSRLNSSRAAHSGDLDEFVSGVIGGLTLSGVLDGHLGLSKSTVEDGNGCGQRCAVVIAVDQLDQLLHGLCRPVTGKGSNVDDLLRPPARVAGFARLEPMRPDIFALVVATSGLFRCSFTQQWSRSTM